MTEIEILQRYGFDEDAFKALQERVEHGELSKSSVVLGGHIEPAQPGDVGELPELSSAEGQRLLALGRGAFERGEVGVVVVAGGMATRFGGGAKAIVEVKDGESFIGLEARDGRQAAAKYGHPVPLGIMTSFATHDAIAKHLEEQKLTGPHVRLFSQGVSLRMTPDGAVYRDADGHPSPYAPGHGEFFKAMNKPAADGRSVLDCWPTVKTVFFKNVDNKGALISSDAFAVILGFHLDRQNDMTAEVVAKRKGDAGGVVARVDGRLRGIEGFRLTGDQTIFTDFSPNNLLFKAEALRSDIPMSFFYVEKTVDGTKVVQLEQVALEASGFSGLKFGAIRVPRERFVPVKEPSDLQTLQAALKGPLGRAYGFSG